jgi:hypothetical protein
VKLVANWGVNFASIRSAARSWVPQCDGSLGRMARTGSDFLLRQPPAVTVLMRPRHSLAVRDDGPHLADDDRLAAMQAGVGGQSMRRSRIQLSMRA